VLRQRLAGASEAEQDRILAELVRFHASAALGHDSPDEVDAEATFMELGLSSLTAMDLSNRLNMATGLDLSSVLVFDNPTPMALARHLRAELAAATGPGSTGEGLQAAPVPDATPETTGATEPVNAGGTQ
jgi:aryl carrier-like protein